MGRKESNQTNKTGNPITGTLANSEDPDEMPHDAAFHQGLLCLLRENQSSGTEVHFDMKILTCDPLICTINHPWLRVAQA